MSKKKKSKASAPSQQKSFGQQPFRQLKGQPKLAAGEGRPAKSQEQTRQTPAHAGEGEEQDFYQAMRALGVTPKQGQDTVLPEETWEEEDTSAAEDAGKAEGEPPLADEDTELFLQALGDLDTIFQDQYPPAAEETPGGKDQPAASPRRIKQLRQGRVRPQAQLDLHGCYRQEALSRTRHFLEAQQRQGHSVVLLITGRGRHSQEEQPVLRQALEAFFGAEGRRWAVEWCRAPQRYGGAGALVVFLR